jgi:UDP-2-acetamido-3-amino-2,3-dideoxy-glucuronate N-acetyltransferase
LANEEPESVLTTGGNYLHKRIADVTTTHIEFPSGLQAHIFVSWLHPYKVQQLVVVGEKKMAVFNDILPWSDKLLLYPHKIRWENNVPIPDKGEPEKVFVTEAEPLRMECQHFLDCIKNASEPITNGNEGLRVLRVLNSSQKSLDENGLKIFLKNETNAINSSIIPKLSRERAVTGTEDYYVHPTSIVDVNCEIGKETKIWHFSHVLSGSKIGEKCNIGQNVVIGPDVTIGENCKLQNNVSVYKGVTLEDNVFCGPSIVFTNVYNPRSEIKKMDQLRTTLVKKGVTIGANSTIVCGITLGKYSFIGAGAVVTKDTEDYALVLGNPARKVGYVCECGVRINSNFICNECGKKYIEDNNKLKLLSQN